MEYPMITLPNKHILIIDDDQDLASITSDALESCGYRTTCVSNGTEAFDVLVNGDIHLILLDINLPKELGFDFCAEIRKTSDIPIIFISARTSEDDKIVGLDMGGDDYLAKPYSLKELASRVNSLIRRTYGVNKEEGQVQVGELILNPSSRQATVRGKVISLSLKEFDLLLYLTKHKNNAVTKEKLFNEVWGPFCEVEMSTVSVHIRWLREKLEENPSNPKYIKTVWGIGYKLCEDVEE